MRCRNLSGSINWVSLKCGPMFIAVSFPVSISPHLLLRIEKVERAPKKLAVLEVAIASGNEKRGAKLRAEAEDGL